MNTQGTPPCRPSISTLARSGTHVSTADARGEVDHGHAKRCRFTSTQALCLRLSQWQDGGSTRDEHASLAKGVCTVRMWQEVGWAREVLGANGIVLHQYIGRFVVDAEGYYSYEGTRKMNSLMVGRGITGFSAFVWSRDPPVASPCFRLAS